MKKTFKKLSLMLIVSLIVLSFCGCSLLSLLYPAYEVDEYADAITRTSIAYLQNVFVNDKLTNDELIQAAVNGANAILQTYDNYGFFLTPQQLYDLDHPQPSDGDGFFFGFTYSQIKYVGLYVKSVVVDSGAYWQGLLAGDIIKDITHDDETPLTYNEKELDVRTASAAALQTCMGKDAGTDTYKFTVKRGATEEGCFEDGVTLPPLYIQRGTIFNDNIPDEMPEEDRMYFVEYYGGTGIGNVSSKTIELRSLEKLDDSDIGYIRILEFSKYKIDGKEIGAADEVETALDALKAEGKKKIIIDLQDNPGGSVDQVEKIARFFIAKEGIGSITVATLEGRNDHVDTYTTTSKYGSYFEGLSGNIVVLTNGNSASGSEMLLGAILDYRTGVQVGTTTFGKGIAQRYYGIEELTGKAINLKGEEVDYPYGVYLTVAYYYSPHHINIHGTGYTPEEENIITDYESQMQRALDLLGN